MSRRVAFFVVGLSLWFARPAMAADLSFTSFHSDITVHKDASINVVETITADFATEHHGIFRTIPYSFKTLDGGYASIPITISAVTQDGQTAKYSVTTDGTNVTAKIGDPNETISGPHTYIIIYTAQAATNFFADHDELYWNVTGDQWDAPITNISAEVQFATDVTDTNGVPPAITQTACYTGPAGSTAHNCAQSHDGPTANFSSNDFLTVVVGWPTGCVTKPANFDQLRQAGTVGGSGEPFVQQSGLSGWRFLVNLALILLTTVVMWHEWRQRGQDPGSKRTIIAQYDPPADLRPAEVSYLYNTQVTPTALSATIIDLAVRGYLKIKETEAPVFLGLGHKHDYQLQQLRSGDSTLRPYEQQLFDALFANPAVPADNGVIALSSFRNKPSALVPFRMVRSTLAEAMGNSDYFVGNPTAVKVAWAIPGAVLLGLAYVLVHIGASGWLAFGLGPAGVIALIFALVMSKHSPQGVEVLWHIRGFRLFLSTAEKYRLQWQEREGIFEQFLPFAMALGVAQKWSQALASLSNNPPSWYEGSFAQGYSAVYLWSSLSSFSTQVSASAVSGAASGSSGFGGGGFSGGGGGGGGGAGC